MLVADAGGGNPDYTYTWSNGAEGDTIWVPVTSTTSYTVAAEDLCAAASPTQAVNVSVNIPDNPEVTISGPLTFDCVPETVVLNATGSLGTMPYSYVWSNGITTASNSVSLNSDTTFYVSILDDCGVLSIADTIHIVQNPIPVPELQTSMNVTLDCPGDNASLTAIASGGNSPYNYVWSNGNVASTINVQPSVTTDYIITVTDACFSGSVQDTITVTVEPYTAPSVLVNDTAVLCPGDMVNIASVLQDGNDPFSYSWSDGSSGTNTSVNPTSTLDLILIVSDDCGNEATDTATIEVPEYDVLTTIVSNDDLLLSDTVTICELWSDTLVSSVTGGLSPYSYTWSGTLIEGMSINSDMGILNVNYELPGDSSVNELYTVTVVDECGDESVVQIPVEVISCDVIQPNVFNPNSDFAGTADICGSAPQNNVFNLPCLELYPGNMMTIFDRWGRKCYETADYHLAPWDGGNQASGTYFYVCELPGNKEVVKGYFQLIH